jgi:DNA-binding beta-propeller fold protein YncE
LELKRYIYQDPLPDNIRRKDMVITQKRFLATVGLLILLLGLGLSYSDALSKSGPQHIYVTDTVNNRIVRMDDMNGTNWTTFGTSGDGTNQFMHPEGIFVDTTGKIYVADSGNNRIVRIDDMTGKNWISIGIQGSNLRQFDSPEGVFLDASGKIYVKDTHNNRIVRMDDMRGTNWIVFDNLGGDDRFHFLYGHIFLDAAGKIYVGDDGNHRIVRIDDMNGKNLTMLGTEGGDPKQFRLPEGIFVNTAGKIYVADAGNHYIIQMDDMTGKNWVFLGNNTPGIPNPNYARQEQWFLPFDVVLDTDGKIYVADTTNNRITRMDDMTGKNWTTFGAGGSGLNQFRFPRGVFLR